MCFINGNGNPDLGQRRLMGGGLFSGGGVKRSLFFEKSEILSSGRSPPGVLVKSCGGM